MVGSMITKALVTIEVEFNTRHVPVQEGLGESSNPSHQPRSRIVQAKRDFIWDQVHEWVAGKPEFVCVRAVRFPA